MNENDLYKCKCGSDLFVDAVWVGANTGGKLNQQSGTFLCIVCKNVHKWHPMERTFKMVPIDAKTDRPAL